jgi:hypothetical protein
MKDLTTRNVIVRSNSIGLIYMMRLSRSITSSHIKSSAIFVVAAPHILFAVATFTWHRRLGHPGPDTFSRS